MENRFYKFKDAVREAIERLDRSLLVDNAGDEWDCYNLLDLDDERQEGGDVYWCVGWDGSIGYTDDNGYHVRWDYKAVDENEEDEE